MRNKIIHTLCFAIAITFIFTAKQASAQQVQATGQAVIYDKDVAAARDKAIQDGLRKAVEQAIGTMINSETVTQNFQLISDKILSKSSGYVKKYKVVNEKRDGDILAVTVSAEVSQGNLSNDLDAIATLLKRKNMPRILIMVAEQNVGQPGPSYWWGNTAFSTNMDAVENGFMDNWMDKGFKFVDRQAIAGKIKVDSALKSVAPSDSAVKEFASRTGAEIVIVGKAVAADRGKVMNTEMHSVRATMSLRVLRVDNAEIIATTTQNAGAVHIDTITAGTQALQKAAKQAADDLLVKITKRWTQETSGPGTITLTINSVKKSRYLKKIKKIIGNKVRGVQEVRQRSYRKKVAILEIVMKGNANDLAVELEEKDFNNFELEVDEITDNTVTVTMKTE